MSSSFAEVVRVAIPIGPGTWAGSRRKWLLRRNNANANRIAVFLARTHLSEAFRIRFPSTGDAIPIGQDGKRDRRLLTLIQLFPDHAHLFMTLSVMLEGYCAEWCTSLCATTPWDSL